MDIRLNLSNAFLNKTNTTGHASAFSDSFYPVEISLSDLALHITSGKAFTLGYFKSNKRTKQNFVSSQLLALDLDKCPLDTDQIAQEAFIRDYAFLIYRTPSYTPEAPKHRVLFALSEPVEGDNALKRWEAMQQGILQHMAHLKPDKACKDGARLFYGSTVAGTVLTLKAGAEV